MSDFFEKPDPISLQELSSIANFAVVREADKFFMILDAAPLNRAGESDIACFHNPKYLDDLGKTIAGACILEERYVRHLPSTCRPLISTSPYRSFAAVLNHLYPMAQNTPLISETAQISPSATLGKNCTVSDFSVIEDDVVIGDNCYIGPHTHIKKGVHIGNNAHFESHVTLQHCIMGNDVYIKPGVRIGQPGFGFHMDVKGHFNVPQLGCVRIGHDVQIGANTTIDRGSQEDTIIGNGVRIDNLVQIGHNVELGDGCVIVAQVGIAGSTKLGKFVIAAGQVGIAGHLNIGNQVKIGAQSGIMRDIKDKETVAGSPAVPVRQYHKQTVALAKLTQGKRDK